MSELTNKIWTEKYRPATFEDLIFGNKDMLLNYMKHPLGITSFIFYSNHPGTGKTSLAKLIISVLGADSLCLNSSMDRGIDIIREQVSSFARNMSSNPNTKRCIFMDEFDQCTRIAQDSLRNLMEEYSDNTFFIFSCNDVSKIIEPIQSRCVLINFEKPNKAAIQQRIEYICEQEQVKATDKEIVDLVNQCYPDMRSMIKILQTAKVEDKPITFNQNDYAEFLKALKTNNIEYLYNKTYDSDFDVMACNKWLFTHFFNNIGQYDSTKLADIAIRLAEVEKGWTINANVEIVFLANMLQIGKILKG